MAYEGERSANDSVASTPSSLDSNVLYEFLNNSKRQNHNKFNSKKGSSKRGKWPFKRGNNQQKKNLHNKNNNNPNKSSSNNSYTSNKDTSSYSYRSQSNSPTPDYPIDESENLGHVLNFENTPNNVSPKLAFLIVENTYNHEALLDTGSSTDVISYSLIQQWKYQHKITRFTNPKTVKIIKDSVDVIGYISINFCLFLKNKAIQEERKFYVLNTDHDVFILGLPFVKDHVDEIELKDLVDVDYEQIKTNYNKRNQIQVNMSEYSERYLAG